MNMLNDQRRFVEAQEKEIARDILADFAKKKSRMAGSVLTTAGDLNEEDVGAQTVLFPKSGSVKGLSIYPSAMGEGGTGRADVTYKKGDQGRYVYMLSKEGQERAQNIAAGAESVGERASAFLKDMTKKGQLISMDPESKAPYGIKPKLSEIL